MDGKLGATTMQRWIRCNGTRWIETLMSNDKVTDKGR